MRDFRHEARRCGGFSEQHSVGCGFPKNQHTLLSMRLSFLVTTNIFKNEALHFSRGFPVDSNTHTRSNNETLPFGSG